MKSKTTGSLFVPTRAHSWITVFALLFSWTARGHGTEFLLAKLQFDGRGSVRLELSADYAQNPMIEGEDAAEEILRHVLRVRQGDEWRELSGLRFEHRAKVDPTAPIPTAPPNDTTPHTLLTAVWDATPADGSITFAVRERSVHDVVLWTVDPSAPATDKPKWLMLVAGDQTPPIAVPKATARKALWLLPLVAGGIVAFSLAAWAFFRLLARYSDRL